MNLCRRIFMKHTNSINFNSFTALKQKVRNIKCTHVCKKSAYFIQYAPYPTMHKHSLYSSNNASPFLVVLFFKP